MTIAKVSTLNADHYYWGDGADGWHLVKSRALSVIQERLPVGGGEVLHKHHQAEQFFYVLLGCLSINVFTDENLGGQQAGAAQQTIELLAGEGVHIPAGVYHQISNTGEQDVHFLVVSTPPSHGDKQLPASETILK